MSLNPFHRFRKHQKTLLAIVTIFTMIIFIFSFGPGDIFSTGGGRRDPNEAKPVATLYGQSLYANDVDRIRANRELASIYMLELLDRSHGIIMERVKLELVPTLKDDKEKELALTVRRIVDLWERAFRPDEKSRESAFFSRYQYFNPQSLDMNIKRLQFLEAQMPAKDNRDKKELLQMLIGVLEQDKRVSMMQQAQGSLSYFGGGSLNSVRDLLDFKIWLHEADRLGIHLSSATLTTMVRQEAQNQIAAAALPETMRVLKQRGMKEVTPDGLESALRDEYRVRLARLAVLGFDAAGVNLPPSVTPYDVYQFYRENRMENSVALLPVSADRKDFLSAVPEPKEEELKAFYNKYKKREDDPGAREPGFKAPPKRTIEWVSARADSPFYKEEAKKERERIREASVAAMQVLAGQLGATGVTPAAAIVSIVPQKFDLVVHSRHAEMRYNHRAADWFEGYNSTLHDVSVNRAENVAALVGQAIGVGGTQTTILSAPAALVGAAYSHDARYRSRLWTDAFLASTHPTPLTAFGIVQAVRPEGEYVSGGVYLPLEKIRNVVEERVMEVITRRLVHENLKTVDDELEKLVNEPGDELLQKDRAGQASVVASTLFKAVSAGGTGASPIGAGIDYSGAVTYDEKKVRAREAASLVLGGRIPLFNVAQVYQKETVGHARARAYIAEAVKKYGLEHGATTKPRDQYDIADDAGLAALKQAFDKPWSHMSTTPKPKKFGLMFFPARDNRQPMSPYKPQPMPPGNVRNERGFDEWAISSNPSLYWTTSENPAFVPTYEDVKGRVLERWKLTKAREMAKKDAEAIAAEINKSNSPDAGIRILRNNAEKIGSNILYLDRVARLSAPQPAALMTRQPGTNYERYKVPEDRVEYPSARFAMDLQNMAKTGEAKVLVDRPEATYYVAVLQSRSLPDFYTEFSRHEKSLMERMEQDVHPRLRFLEGVVAQLEKSANLTILDEDFEKNFTKDRRRNRGDD